jgi:hypothetical protein
MGAVLTKLIFIVMKRFRRKVGNEPTPWKGFLNFPTTEEGLDVQGNYESFLEYILNH